MSHDNNIRAVTTNLLGASVRILENISNTSSTYPYMRQQAKIVGVFLNKRRLENRFESKYILCTSDGCLIDAWPEYFKLNTVVQEKEATPSHSKLNSFDNLKSMMLSGFKLFAIIHHHEYGDTVYSIWCRNKPTEEQIVKFVLESTFEPSKDEYLIIEEIDLNHIKSIG